MHKSTDISTKQIMRFIPKDKREAVRDAWADSDGIWIMLKPGWEASHTDSGVRTIHVGGADEEDEIGWPRIKEELLFEIDGIRKK